MWNKLSITTTILFFAAVALLGVVSLELSATINDLAIEQERLADTLVVLDDLQSKLDEREELLEVIQTKLIGTEAQLKSTQNQLDTAETQLSNTQKQLETTSSQLATAQSKNSQMLTQYTSLRTQINARFGLSTVDIQSCITPNDSSVASKVTEITGGYSSDVNEYWRDFERLYRWVVNNITYSYDSYVPILPDNISGELNWRGDCWRMPEETLEDETGDCEDMALLLASMLISYNENKYAVWLLTIHSEQESSSHLAVAFPVVDNKLTILDPAGNYHTGYPSSLKADSISVAVNNWLLHWSHSMPGAEIIQVFSSTIDEHFSSTDEFITWANE